MSERMATTNDIIADRLYIRRVTANTFSLDVATADGVLVHFDNYVIGVGETLEFPLHISVSVTET